MKAKRAANRIATEDRVRNAVVGHIASKGYSKNLVMKANDQHGVDIFATHVDNAARRILVEAKGETPKVNRNLSILTAWGQLLSRVTAINANRIHGLAFPAEWKKQVVKLSSHIVASHLNVHYFFVDGHSTVEELTAAKLRQEYSAVS